MTDHPFWTGAPQMPEPRSLIACWWSDWSALPQVAITLMGKHYHLGTAPGGVAVAAEWSTVEHYE